MAVSKHLSATRTTLRLMDDIPLLRSTFQYGIGKEVIVAIINFTYISQ